MGRGTRPRQLFVKKIPRGKSAGVLIFANFCLPCVLGRSGLRALKREGDGATPIGAFPVRRVLYRADRMRRPRCRLSLSRIGPTDGWCDAVEDRNYNRPVRHPYPASAEHLWRSDSLYDCVVVLGHNDVPRTRGMGSAVFLHVASERLHPTEGCIALRLPDLMKILPYLNRRVRLHICP